MRSTFESLETARRALAAQQAALQTTSQNIANANTPGYSRERVNLSTTLPYATPGMNNPVTPGQVGTGVKADTVQRVRQDFLDVQYRDKNTKYGYYGARSDALSQMESILNEPSDAGLSKTIDNFWNSIQDLVNNPKDTGTRSEVLQNGKAVASTFHYLANSLVQVQGNVKAQINTSVKEVNSLAKQINSLNQQISQVEPHGYLANGLYDKRDLLVDQLSQLVNVKVSNVKSGGDSLDIAPGRYTIQVVSDTGKAYTLVDGKNLKANEMSVSYSPTDGSASFSINHNVVSDSVSGKLQGLKESYNKIYPNMLDSLNQMAFSLVKSFNAQHEKGYGLNGNTGYDFFQGLTQVKGAAQAISLDSDVTGNLDHIAASTDGSQGDNGNAASLAEVITGPMTINGQSTTLKSYYEATIGGMAVNAQEASRLSDNSLTLQQSADKRRQSVSGVSLDEEMVNLIKYQHAYSAAARVVTTVNQNLNRIINQMGL